MQKENKFSMIKAIKKSGKPRIKTTAWGNVYGYIGTSKVISFSDLPTASQEEQAESWLQSFDDLKKIKSK